MIVTIIVIVIIIVININIHVHLYIVHIVHTLTIGMRLIRFVQERVPRAVRHTGESKFRLKASLAAAAAVVQSALSGSRKDPRPFAGRRG